MTTRLRRFVLRSRLRIDDLTADTRIHGVTGSDTSEPAVLGTAAPAGIRVLRASEGHWQRAYVLQALDQTTLSPPEVMCDARQWQSLEVAAAIPEVVPATSEMFVAQMLNLDCIDGVSFGKGCYTGQEVIARAHFRGRVKRRMQRFVTDAGRELAAGVQLVLAMAAARRGRCAEPSGGRRQFLAVAPLPAAAGDDSGAVPAGQRVPFQQLSLPYPLPD